MAILTRKAKSAAVNVHNERKRQPLAGRLVEHFDENRRLTKYAYDGMGRLVETVLPDGATTSLTYDNVGRLTDRIMPGGLTWKAVYRTSNPGIGQLEQETLENAGNVSRKFTYAYDSIGRLETKTDVLRNNLVTSFAYDDYGRVETRSTSGGSPDLEHLTLTYGYDARSLLTTLTQDYANALLPDSVVNRVYNPYGQLATETVNIAGVEHSSFAQSYDSGARRTSLKDASSHGFTYEHSASGQLSQVTELISGSLNTYSYDYSTSGLLKERNNAALRTTINARTRRGQVLERTLTDQVAGSVDIRHEHTFNWSPNSRLVSFSAHDTVGFDESRSYAYNFRDQLVEETFNRSAIETTRMTYQFDTNRLGVLTGTAQYDDLTSSIPSSSERVGLDAFYRTSSYSANGGYIEASGKAQTIREFNSENFLP